MEGNLILLNYDSEKCDTGVPIDDIQSIVITVVSGDEIATVTKKTGEVETFDSIVISGSWRHMGFYDGTYSVDMNNFEKWAKRKDSYDWNRFDDAEEEANEDN